MWTIIVFWKWKKRDGPHQLGWTTCHMNNIYIKPIYLLYYYTVCHQLWRNLSRTNGQYSFKVDKAQKVRKYIMQGLWSLVSVYEYMAGIKEGKAMVCKTCWFNKGKHTSWLYDDVIKHNIQVCVCSRDQPTVTFPPRKLYFKVKRVITFIITT